MKRSCLYWNDSHAIRRVASALDEGKVVFGTSDTILGLLAPLTKAGFNKLNEIKGRSGKPYIVLIGKPDQVLLFTEKLSSTIKTLINRCWPGPLTLILKAKKNIPSFLTSKKGAIALRMPRHQGILKLLCQFDGLFSTSANKEGQPVPQKISEVDSSIIEQTSFCVLDRPRQRKLSGIPPSTILDCTGRTIRIVREGAYSIQMLEELVGRAFKK